MEADLQPKGVPRAEAGRARADLEEGVPYGGRAVGRRQQLHPVLARVAGSADEALGARDLQDGGVHARGQLARGEGRHHAPRVGPLDREHRVAVDRVADLGVELAGVLGEPREVALVVGGVGDRQVAVVVQPVGEQVVQDATVLAAEHRVLGRARLQSRDVVGEEPLEQVSGVRAGGLDLAHVGDVEHPAGRADGDVLLPHSLVGDRHLPSGERDELRPSGGVCLVKRCALQRRGGHGVRLLSQGEA